MKAIRHLIVASALGAGFVSAAEAHVFVGVGFAAPVVPVVPVYVPPPVYAPAPVYYAPPPPIYRVPVVIGYYGHPHYYGRWHYGYGHGYWRQ
jgi:hypothetical protein